MVGKGHAFREDAYLLFKHNTDLGYYYYYYLIYPKERVVPGKAILKMGW